MRKVLLISFLFSLFLWEAPAFAQTPTPVYEIGANLLKNPSFESGGSQWTGAGATLSNIAYSGSKSMLFSSGGYRCQTLALSSGRYQASAWVNPNSVDQIIQIGLGPLTQDWTISDGIGSWYQYTAIFSVETPGNQSYCVTINDGSAYIDDTFLASITIIPPVTPTSLPPTPTDSTTASNSFPRYILPTPSAYLTTTHRANGLTIGLDIIHRVGQNFTLDSPIFLLSSVVVLFEVMQLLQSFLRWRNR